VLLYTAPLSPTGKARLKAMAETTDGFEIARRDLEIRGPGRIHGRAPERRRAAALCRPGRGCAAAAAARAAGPAAAAEHPAAAQAHVARWLASRADLRP
jgi:ATP-dependent DNA helicase RecG